MTNPYPKASFEKRNSFILIMVAKKGLERAKLPNFSFCVLFATFKINCYSWSSPSNTCPPLPKRGKIY